MVYSHQANTMKELAKEYQRKLIANIKLKKTSRHLLDITYSHQMTTSAKMGQQKQKTKYSEFPYNNSSRRHRIQKLGTLKV